MALTPKGERLTVYLTRLCRRCRARAFSHRGIAKKRAAPAAARVGVTSEEYRNGGRPEGERDLRPPCPKTKMDSIRSNHELAQAKHSRARNPPTASAG